MYFRFCIVSCILLLLIQTRAEEDLDVDEDDTTTIKKNKKESVTQSEVKNKNDHKSNNKGQIPSMSRDKMVYIEPEKVKKSKKEEKIASEFESKCSEYKAIQRVTAITLRKFENEHPNYFKCVTDCSEMTKDPDIYLPVFPLDFINCNIKLSWQGAAKWCRLHGLRLAEIDSKSKDQDVIEFVKTSADMKSQLATLKLWIAATDIGKTNKKFYWSETGKDLESKLSQMNKYNCIMLSGWTDKSTTWISHDCKEKNSFVCEVTSLCYKERCFVPFNSSYPIDSCKSQSCNSYKCVAKPNFSTKDGNLQVSPDMGVVVTTCGKQYVFSSLERPFYDAYKMCCDLGLKLISLKTLSDVECIRKLFTDTGVQPKTTAFWSSGYDKSCKPSPESYLWCSTNEKFTLQAPWLPDQPAKQNNLENCVSLYLSPRASGLLNRNCQNAIRFICEGQSTTDNMSKSTLNEIMSTLSNVNSSTRVVPKLEPFVKTGLMGAAGIKSMKDLNKICPILWCKEDEGIYDENNELTVNASVGTIVKVCGKTYMLSKGMTASTTLWAKCCKLGMYAATVNSREELNCLLAWYKVENRKSDTFIVNSFDNGLNRTFSTCDENLAPVPEEMWFPGEPNNLGGMDVNIVVYLSASNVGGLIDIPGTDARRYMCQVPETKRKWRRIFKPNKSERRTTMKTTTEDDLDD